MLFFFCSTQDINSKIQNKACNRTNFGLGKAINFRFSTINRIETFCMKLIIRFEERNSISIATDLLNWIANQQIRLTIYIIRRASNQVGFGVGWTQLTEHLWTEPVHNIVKTARTYSEWNITDVISDGPLFCSSLNSSHSIRISSNEYESNDIKRFESRACTWKINDIVFVSHMNRC